ncbi:MAG: class I SAM-dependent methyltransferase [Bacteroidales bacterium]|nr:class I SAM-dependent methyltransferase [Bacteroidales bacterium]MCF8386901.1 class I SAM-dependent methyltransferase [Bacteroidales bacterium]MCF8396984.1 class I SAM-dependent methyltransferase [Bacteroidales bacterium]
MSKLKKLFKGIGLLIRKPALINHVIDDEEVWRKYVVKKFNIESLPVVTMEHLFPGFSAHIPVFAFLDGGSLPTDIALLMKLAEKIDACKYFEIGTWRGESVANVARHAEECYTLNLPDEKMRELGFPEKYIGLHAFFSKEIENVKHLKGDSRSFDYAALDKKFDLIFIDGDHHYEYVKNDTQKVFEHFVHDNSIVVWHDYAKNPERIRQDVMAGIMDALPKKEHKYLYHVENTLCAIYTKKQLTTKQAEFPVKPDHIFEINLKINSYSKKNQ